MKRCPKCGEVKSISDFLKKSGDVGSYCPPCSKEYQREYSARNSEKKKKAASEWVKKNKERRKEIANRWAKNNYDPSKVDKERALKRYQEWRKNNLEKAHLNEKRYRQRNPEKLAAIRAYKRVGAVIPSWFGEFDKFVIEQAHELRKLRKKATGVEWHVDHVIPLVSPYVCGLHCANNISVITAKENLIKNNRFWPDMPEIAMKHDEDSFVFRGHVLDADTAEVI